MKKSHLTLLIITVLMALFSVYSLAAINQVYKINFEWYSQYYKKYTSDERDLLKDKWQFKNSFESVKFRIITDYDDLKKPDGKELVIPGADFNKYIYFYGSLGEELSPEYRIKFIDIAQRVNVVEVKVSLNSPALADKDNVDKTHSYYPEDIVRIEKSAFPEKGNLSFIFKDQSGVEIYQQNFDVK